MGDVRDPNGVRTAMQGCDVVIHLAALIGIPYSYHSPDTYIDTNIKGTLNILQAARDLNVAKVVHTSTSEVYGTAQFVPITEQHPLQGQSPYSASKIGADQIAMSFYCSFQTPVTIVRPFNTYGPRQSARAVIPTVITQIANGIEQIKLGSLHPTRDFNYIDDTVKGFIAACEADSAIGEVINIGSAFEVSIGETVKYIADIMDSHVDIVSDEQRIRPTASEVERLFADNNKARQLLNWSPQYAGVDGFKQGLNKTIDWFTNNDNIKHYKSHIYNV
jgi:dTDP-glucose 4,6-dehydratase